MVEPVAVEVGFDRFEAHVAVEKCRAHGLSVELALMDDEGLAPGFAGLLHATQATPR